MVMEQDDVLHTSVDDRADDLDATVAVAARDPPRRHLLVGASVDGG
jgi:hypothetical protein